MEHEWCLQATRLIMMHMCKEPFELFWWPITVIVLVIANDWLQLFNANLVQSPSSLAAGGTTYFH